MGTQVMKHDLGLRSVFWSLWQQSLENKVISGRWSEHLLKPEPICEAPEWSRLSGPAPLGFSLFYDNNYWLLVPAEMWNFGTQSPLQGDGETKTRYHVIVIASGFAADEWVISNQRESKGWLTGTVWIQTAILIPWVIFLTQLERELVIKEQGSSDAAIQQHCRTAGRLHVSDWFLQRMTQQYGVLWPSHQFLISLGTSVQFPSPFQMLGTLRHCWSGIIAVFFFCFFLFYQFYSYNWNHSLFTAWCTNCGVYHFVGLSKC